MLKRKPWFFIVIILVTLLAVLVPTITVAASSQTSTDSVVVPVTYQPEKGINYLSEWHWYNAEYTTDEILRRDFSRFQNDGIKYVSLPLWWYRLEGNTQGDYTGSKWYGDAVLENVKRVIAIAYEYNIETMISMHTLWGTDSKWCTPDYVIDPVTGTNQGLAIVRSQEMQDAFIDMFTHTVDYLKGTPGIWCWSLNEPWYSPNNLPAPFDQIDQKENFINLFQRMKDIAKQLDGRPFTVRFPTVHQEPEYVTDIFVDNWNWDERIFTILDFVTFTTYLPENSALIDNWKTIIQGNVSGCIDRGAKVWISEFGNRGGDSTQGMELFKEILSYLKTLPVEGLFVWMWRSDTIDEKFEPQAIKFNICADAVTGDGGPRYYIFVNDLLNTTDTP